jgi:hypothetical protein
MASLDFWRQFQIRVKQKQVIEHESAETKPTYGRRSSRLSGAEIWLTFDANAFASEETTIEVLAPTGRMLTATFALDRLK